MPFYFYIDRDLRIFIIIVFAGRYKYNAIFLKIEADGFYKMYFRNFY